MKKNYVYKVRANGIVYDNFASAVEDCVKDLHTYIGEYVGRRVSKPIIVKTNGGYQVMMIDMGGNIYKRGIDVFVPKHLVEKVDYYIDELRETSVCSCENEDNDYDDDYEEDEENEEDEPTHYCEQCDKECKFADIIAVDGSELCKDCALDYIKDNY